jgi:membrane-bound lytic murein transglycosylase D
VLTLPDRSGGRRALAPKPELEPRPFELVRTAQAMELPEPPKPKSQRIAELKPRDPESTELSAAPVEIAATATTAPKPAPAAKPMATPGAIVDLDERDALIMTAAAAGPTSTPGAVVDPAVRDALVQTATAASETVVAPVETPQRPEPVASLSENSAWRRIRGNMVIVDADETLGHYGEWLEVSVTRLRSLNKLRKGQSLRMGQRVKLDFAHVSAEAFLQRRIEYHKSISDDFFGSYEVVSVKDHRVRPGESIWQISTQTYGVPTWLIHRYNPDADLNRLTPGSKLIVPVVQALAPSQG